MWWLAPRGLQPRREPVDRDVARTQLLGEDGCNGVSAGNGDDGAPTRELTRRVLIDDGAPAHRDVHDDVDTPEHRRRLTEPTLAVELVGDVARTASAVPCAARISSTAASASLWSRR
jgi:hypothetical protein